MSTYIYHKQEKLDFRAKKCMFIGYPGGEKRFKLWCKEGNSSKCFISRDVIFREQEYYLVGESLSMASTDNHERNNAKIEMEQVESGDTQTEASGSANKYDQHDEDDLKNEHQNDLRSYQLSRDKTRRHCNDPVRYGYENLISYALFIVYEMDDTEPNSYREAVGCKDSRNLL